MKKILMALLAVSFLAIPVWAQGTKIVPIWTTTGYDNTGVETLRGPLATAVSGLRLDTMNVMLDFRNVWVAGEKDSMKVHFIVDTTACDGVAPSVDVDIIPATYNNRMQSSVDLGTVVSVKDSCKVGVVTAQYINTVTVRAPISRLLVLRGRTVQVGSAAATQDTIGVVTLKGWIEAPMK